MDKNIQEVIEYINDLPVSDEQKQQLLDRANKEGATDALFTEIDKMLNQVNQDADKQLADMNQEIAAVEKDTAAKMDEAYNEFEAGMIALDEEIDKTVKESSDALDNIDLEEARTTIAKN